MNTLSIKHIPNCVLFYEVFVNISDAKDLASIRRVCKQWASIDKDELYWEFLVKNTFPKHFEKGSVYIKPTNKTWKWTFYSKRPLTSIENYSGIGTFDGYEGEWNEGKQDGFGSTYFFSESRVFHQGVYVTNDQTGYGIVKFSNGDYYEGDLIGCVRQGKGTYKWVSGDIYVGDFNEGRKSGKGKISWASGNYYIGDFKSDRRTGRGEYHWLNGDYYVGEFVDGLKSGKGVQTWVCGDVYNGYYLDQKKCGPGIYKWANGNKYEGEYYNDKRHNFGTFTEADGFEIKGDWAEGVPVVDISTNPELQRLCNRFKEQTPSLSSHLLPVLTAVNPAVQESILKGECTFTRTGKKRRGQLFYSFIEGKPPSTKMTIDGDDRPHGVCVTCYEKCVNKNYYRVETKPIFGGDFFCDCGFCKGDKRFMCHAGGGDNLLSSSTGAPLSPMSNSNDQKLTDADVVDHIPAMGYLQKDEDNQRDQDVEEHLMSLAN